MMFGEFLNALMTHGLEYFGRYYGLYKAQVKSVDDPMQLGRIQVHCEQVHGPNYPRVWAWPVSPSAGNKFGLWAIPDVGEWVWVSFDHGSPAHPIWHGGWWGSEECTDDMTKKKVVLQTKEGMKIVLDRDAKSVLVEQKDGSSVLLSEDSIILRHPVKIQMEAADISIQGKVAIDGDVNVTGDGQVNGDWFAQNNSAHHTHPVVNGTAIRNDP